MVFFSIIFIIVTFIIFLFHYPGDARERAGSLTGVVRILIL